MQENIFDEFVLVGGTALALKLGHRNSIDIDLFGKASVNDLEISPILSNFGDLQLIQKSPRILIYTLNGIKIDFVNYQYEWIKPYNVIEGIRISSLEDIAAMKLSAIAGRGSKKDFFDIHKLLTYFSLKEMVEFYNKKFPDGSEFLVLKSLSYFDDANSQPNPILLENQDWTEVKHKIITEVQKL
jgi:predicted nucleotidyltransferase component of viral defense system